MEGDNEDEIYIDITPCKSKGVLKQILKPGTMDTGPSIGDKVSVHYVGKFLDGTVFESTRENNDSFSFHFGKGEVIQAWELCIATMKKGEVCKIVSTSEFAYEDNGNLPKIPPFTDLIFEIELLDWCGADLSRNKDGSIIKNILEVGEGSDVPNDGASVTVDLIGHVNDVMFDDRKELQFIIGEGSELNVPHGLERALQTFEMGEKSLVKLISKKAFGIYGNPDLKVEPNMDLNYEIKLLGFERAKESWEMSSCQRIESSCSFKEKGSSYFKENKFRLAAHQYEKITNFLSYTESKLDEKKKQQAGELLLAARLNLALCFLKLNDYKHARDHATEAVVLDKQNIKALFRLGEAYLGLDDAEDARKTFLKCKEVDQFNKLVDQRLKYCDVLINKQKRNEKKLFAGMFDKFGKSDPKRTSLFFSSGDVMAGDLGEWEGRDAPEEVLNAQDELKDVEMIYI